MAFFIRRFIEAYITGAFVSTSVITTTNFMSAIDVAVDPKMTGVLMLCSFRRGVKYGIRWPLVPYDMFKRRNVFNFDVTDL